jgi:hypothetical protein
MSGHSGFFERDDAWVLTAIALSRGTLRDIIAAGDFINHAILSFEELEGGMRRLSRAGLVSGAMKALHRKELYGWSVEPQGLVRGHTGEVRGVPSNCSVRTATSTSVCAHG